MNGYESTSFSLTATVDDPAPPPVSPITPPPTTSTRRRGGGGGGGGMTLGLLAALGLLALLRIRPQERRWLLLRFASVAAVAASLGCSSPSTAAADRTATIVLAAPTAAELARLRPTTKGAPYTVGIGREVPLSNRAIALDRLVWTRTAGGVVTSVSVRSSGARSLRVALRLERDYPGLQIVFRGRGAPLSGSALVGSDAQWSPVIPGDTATIELIAPALPPTGIVLEAPRVSHLP